MIKVKMTSEQLFEQLFFNWSSGGVLATQVQWAIKEHGLEVYVGFASVHFTNNKGVNIKVDVPGGVLALTKDSHGKAYVRVSIVKQLGIAGLLPPKVKAVDKSDFFNKVMASATVENSAIQAAKSDAVLAGIGNPSKVLGTPINNDLYQELKKGKLYAALAGKSLKYHNTKEGGDKSIWQTGTGVEKVAVEFNVKSTPNAMYDGYIALVQYELNIVPYFLTKAENVFHDVAASEGLFVVYVEGVSGNWIFAGTCPQKGIYPQVPFPDHMKLAIDPDGLKKVMESIEATEKVPGTTSGDGSVKIAKLTKGVKKVAKGGTKVALVDAKEVGQRVKGTSETVVYRTIALGKQVNIACRLHDGGTKLSWRAERVKGPLVAIPEEIDIAMVIAGFKWKDGFYTNHMLLGGVPPARVVSSVLSSIPDDWKEAAFQGKDIDNVLA